MVKKTNCWKKCVFSFFVVVNLLFNSTSMFAYANNVGADYIFKYEDYEIAISSDLDYHKAELIANKIVWQTAQTALNYSIQGISCLFGHSKAYTTASNTQHNYYSTAPRCRQEIYKVEYCTRSDCDYCTYTLNSVNSLNCH